MKPIFLLLVLSGGLAQVSAQDYRLHAPQDHAQAVPFWMAYAAGLASIEVDIVWQARELYVAHEAASIQPGRTLQALYLDPIRLALRQGYGGPRAHFQLLLDLKTAAAPTLAALVDILDQYPDIRYDSLSGRGVSLVVSGQRPPVTQYPDYPAYLQFDCQELAVFDTLSPHILDRVALFSYSFARVSPWNGKGRLTATDSARVADLIARVHARGKPLRFWAAPDSKTAWAAFAHMGVDYIHTQRYAEAAAYLRTLPQRSYHTPTAYAVYAPTYAQDGLPAPVRRVILLIGDGNSLAHIAAGRYAHPGGLHLERLRHIGLVHTASADDFTTDSAAGGSALATGHKVRNRALGVSPTGQPLPNLPERLRPWGFRAGILTTDGITGATPAAFYAHQPDRDASAGIAADLCQSQLDLIIGGDLSALGPDSLAAVERLTLAGFHVVPHLDSLPHTPQPRVACLPAFRGLPLLHRGRAGWLPTATRRALAFLEKQDAPFFLMVENGHVDVAGHWNQAGMLIEEVLDFDQAVGEALQFADTHPGTLVLVTADHETGGLTLPHGDLTRHTVELDFSTQDHSGIPVPLFAYGPHARDFGGMYANTEVFHRLMALLSQYYAAP